MTLDFTNTANNVFDAYMVFVSIYDSLQPVSELLVGYPLTTKSRTVNTSSRLLPGTLYNVT